MEEVRPDSVESLLYVPKQNLNISSKMLHEYVEKIMKIASVLAPKDYNKEDYKNFLVHLDVTNKSYENNRNYMNNLTSLMALFFKRRPLFKAEAVSALSVMILGVPEIAEFKKMLGHLRRENELEPFLNLCQFRNILQIDMHKSLNLEFDFDPERLLKFKAE